MHSINWCLIMAAACCFSCNMKLDKRINLLLRFIFLKLCSCLISLNFCSSFFKADLLIVIVPLHMQHVGCPVLFDEWKESQIMLYCF